MGRPKKAAAAKGFPDHYYYEGILQVGDVRLWNLKNLHAVEKQVYSPVARVDPGDIVDKLDPKKRYTFYLYTESPTDDSARERDRLRRAKWFKCDTERFCSPTAKFETRDGVLVLGLGIWYALPEALIPRKDARQRQQAMDLIANAHADLADSARAHGYEAVEAQTRNDLRGQRTK